MTDKLFRWLKPKCKHEVITGFRVSGYGYTEYEISFCKKCEELLWHQTQKQQ